MEWDPQLRHRNMYPVAENEEFGAYKFEAYAPKLSRTPATIRQGSPRWGEDNDYVYGQLLGKSSAEIAQLREAGVI